MGVVRAVPSPLSGKQGTIVGNWANPSPDHWALSWERDIYKKGIAWNGRLKNLHINVMAPMLGFAQILVNLIR